MTMGIFECSNGKFKMKHESPPFLWYGKEYVIPKLKSVNMIITALNSIEQTMLFLFPVFINSQTKVKPYMLTWTNQS